MQERSNQMGYLVDFEQAIEDHDASKMMRLWEEYTSTDEVDGEDYLAILKVVKESTLTDYIGRHIERGLHLWEKIEDRAVKDEVLQLMVDIEVNNDPNLREATMQHLNETFGAEKDFAEKMRLIGLRSPSSSFKGCISHYLLLNHMKKGNFVYHTQGWGVGEIMEVSLLREQLGLEFDYAPGRKEMPFKIAFATLVPLPADHFLAQRFGNPDALEAYAKKYPVETIQKLLGDLGPKTAAEIKDELCELVIPEDEWNRWWQTARAKIKKDTHIESPSDIKKPFRLLKNEVSHEERLEKALKEEMSAKELIHLVYSHLKDFSSTLKNEAFKESLDAKLKELLSFQETTEAEKLQIHFFLQDLSGEKKYPPIEELLKRTEMIEELLKEIAIQSLKKRALAEIRKIRKDWKELFLELLFTVEHGSLRDYIITELLKTDAKDELTKKLEKLFIHPITHPELVIWYFQKILDDSTLPLSDAEGKSTVFEAFLILLAALEQSGDRKELVKKMQGILTAKRYEVVRKMMKTASLSDVKEFLLLVTKCQALSEHDIQIFQSLAEVAYPSLATGQAESVDEDVIWTTKEGYTQIQKRIEHIGTVETVENAKEIEVARAHGDLRENAEFKAALERRDRLQSELKLLSNQLSQARILTKEEIDTDLVGVGTVVDCEDENGKKVSYTILGPWDADPDHNILSFKSKLAQEMSGLQVGNTFQLQNKTFTIKSIRSAL